MSKNVQIVVDKKESGKKPATHVRSSYFSVEESNFQKEFNQKKSANAAIQICSLTRETFATIVSISVPVEKPKFQMEKTSVGFVNMKRAKVIRQVWRTKTNLEAKAKA